MKVLIDIPEEDYKKINSKEKIITISCDIASAIKNSTPLEQIRQEIEQRIHEAILLEQIDGDVFYAGRNDGLQTAIDIIDKYMKGEQE